MSLAIPSFVKFSTSKSPTRFHEDPLNYWAMHLTQVTQFVVAGSWRSIRARCWSFAIGSATMRRAGTISPGCGGRKGSAARYAARRIIGSRRGACVTAGECGRQTSVTAGTLFADTHLPLRLWFEALWHVTSQKSGASALGLQRVLGLGSYRTAWNLLHKLRRAMVRPGRERLQGIVEVDESSSAGRDRVSEGAGRRARCWSWSRHNRRPKGSVASG